MVASDFEFEFDGKECQDCGGKCCTGESGYIFATIDELIGVSEFLGTPFDELTQKYVRKVGYKFSFLEKKSIDGWACVFFDDGIKKCRIYDVRPKQCRDFPFWEGHKKNKIADGELQSLCQLCKGVKCTKIS
ncbi:YkgJ family cysteine cluster protein [Helicobacter sp. 11S02596-1]|uniref:YkgJ family cysteine cluster protein n=1 Tax=Helicobacter sp. 11S02596-1 TaxID=1476194 RepID=UPI000BA51621|nr:YkgJ family cysteine cluster protein [Helicobacter sp. 11S02596-1]PAF44680.1 zinc/iron-chelating domain-containing protein [Helicobacter sp. 11S02596-1]